MHSVPHRLAFESEAASSRTFLAAVKLLCSQSGLILLPLQLVHAVLLELRRLARNQFLAGFNEKMMQLLKAMVHVLTLLATIISLDDERIGFGSMIARSTNFIM